MGCHWKVVCEITTLTWSSAKYWHDKRLDWYMCVYDHPQTFCQRKCRLIHVLTLSWTKRFEKEMVSWYSVRVLLENRDQLESYWIELNSGNSDVRLFSLQNWNHIAPTEACTLLVLCCVLVSIDYISILQRYHTGTGVVFDCPCQSFKYIR